MKKVYVEITNACNLNCNFCIHNSRKQEFMTLDNFKIILKKLDGYTKYLYLHVLGEPLLHPLINEFIEEAYNNSFNVNITSNGYLIDRIKTKNIRQLNVSLHSFLGDESAFVKYLDKILNKADLLDKTYISLRFWVKSDFLDLTLYIINNRYHTNITLKKLEKQHSIRVNNHIFINLFHEFIWPDLNNTKSSSKGTCYALRDHFGILVDGTVVPCCLDSKGIINLGNIYKDEVCDILNSKRVCKMKDGFLQNWKEEELCQKCFFLNNEE